MITPLRDLGFNFLLMTRGDTKTFETIHGEVRIRKIKASGNAWVYFNGTHKIVKVYGRSRWWVYEICHKNHHLLCAGDVHDKLPSAWAAGINKAIDIMRGRNDSDAI